MEYIKIFGPWAIALVSFIAFIVNYRYNRKKDIESKSEINNLKKLVTELNNQTKEIELIRKESGIANEINAKSVLGLREQIFELRRQTEQFVKTNEFQQKISDSNYLPDLFISDTVFHIYGFERNGYILALSYSSSNNKDESNSFRSDFVDINILNIGFAPAKSVQIKWDFDISEALSRFELIKGNSIYDATYSNGTLEIQSPIADYRHMNFASNQMREKEVNFILPATIDKNPKQIDVPRALIDLYSIFICSKMGHYRKDEKNDRTFTLDDFPKLNITFKYKDLQNKLHEKRFELEFQLRFLNGLNIKSSKTDSPIGTIGIKVTEKNNTTHNKR